MPKYRKAAKPAHDIAVQLTEAAKVTRELNMIRCAITAVPMPSPLGKYGDLMTIDQYVAACESGAFIDSDGWGFFSDGVYTSDAGSCSFEEHETFESTDCIMWNAPIPTHYTPQSLFGTRPSQIKTGTFNPPAWATHVHWYNR